MNILIKEGFFACGNVHAKKPVAVNRTYEIMTGRRNSGSGRMFQTVSQRHLPERAEFKYDILLPNVPLFSLDRRRITPSSRGPATAVPMVEATKDDRLDAPTELTEKLYGGAEKICERVMDIKTSHEMQVVKSRVAQTTAGDESMKNGRISVLQNDIWS